MPEVVPLVEVSIGLQMIKVRPLNRTAQYLVPSRMNGKSILVKLSHVRRILGRPN